MRFRVLYFSQSITVVLKLTSRNWWKYFGKNKNQTEGRKRMEGKFVQVSELAIISFKSHHFNPIVWAGLGKSYCCFVCWNSISKIKLLPGSWVIWVVGELVFKVFFLTSIGRLTKTCSSTVQSGRKEKTENYWTIYLSLIESIEYRVWKI